MSYYEDCSKNCDQADIVHAWSSSGSTHAMMWQRLNILPSDDAQMGIPEITINVPGRSGLTATLTNAHDEYKEGLSASGRYNIFYTYLSGTVTFNLDVTVSYGSNFGGANDYSGSRIIHANETVRLTDFPDRNADGGIREGGEIRIGSVAFRAHRTMSNVGLLGSGETLFPLRDISAQNVQAPPQTQTPPSESMPQTVSPTSSSVLVNGTLTAFEAYNIGGNNFFKLRDLAYVLNSSEKQFAVGWNGAANAISLTSGAPYEIVGGEMVQGGEAAKTAVPTTSRIFLDGTERV